MNDVVETIDLKYLGLRGAIASYLISGPGGFAVVEAGPGSTLEELKRGLARRGVGLEDVRDVVVTHVHLDHAGAAGLVARHGARVWVHEAGAKHLIDPRKLVESARRIYGEQMERLWGKIAAVPAGQVRAVKDGEEMEVAGVKLRAVETAGHAKHHHAYVMEAEGERICFAGDAAGIVVPREAWGEEEPGGRFLIVPTPPPEFDVEAWQASVGKLRAEQADALYLTHFGRVEEVDEVLGEVERRVEEEAAWVRAKMERGAERGEMLEEYMRREKGRARAAGLSEWAISQYVSNNLLSMNVDGVRRYWEKKGNGQAI